ncbi:hypothetical protein [Micromonospora sp. NPDC005087]|uniref:hypothetical protein n=1 Tax=Micromonospora sp. NPDC005087 TaxID=3364225 RepID=UPI0036C56931
MSKRRKKKTARRAPGHDQCARKVRERLAALGAEVTVSERAPLVPNVWPRHHTELAEVTIRSHGRKQTEGRPTRPQPSRAVRGLLGRWTVDRQFSWRPFSSFKVSGA